MTYKEFKIWQAGFLAGCKKTSIEDLNQEQFSKVIEQFNKMEEGLNKPVGGYTITYPGSLGGSYSLRDIFNKL